MLILALFVALPVQIEPDSGLFSNAFYHVACLAEAIDCSKADFSRFWQEELGWNDTDNEALDGFKSVLADVVEDAPEHEPVPFPPNFPGYYPGMRAQASLLSAVLESGSATEIRAFVGDSVSSSDQEKLASAFGHFVARLRPWWESKSKIWLQAHQRSALEQIEESGLGDLMNKMGEFLAARVSQIGLHIIHLPESANGSRATIIDNHVFVETDPNDDPTNSVWKVLHEMTHVLYDRGPPERHRELITQFIQSEPPHAMSLYVLLNEAVATGLQLMVFDRLQIQMENFYSDPLVATVAQSAKPLLVEALSGGSTLYEGFSHRYIRVASEDLGHSIHSPRFILAGTVLLGMESYPQSAGAFLRGIAPRLMWDSEDGALAFPEVNVVRLLTHDEIDLLRPRLALDESFLRHRAFVYLQPSTSKRKVFWISGRDEGSLTEAVGAFVQLQDASSVGRLVTIE